MFKCYDKNFLKCDKCQVPFNSYDQPRFLPCRETICSACYVKIEIEAINKKLFCSSCLADHYIPHNGFPINKMIHDLITTEPMEMSRGENPELLQQFIN
jgi:hypothetical protein